MTDFASGQNIINNYKDFKVIELHAVTYLPDSTVYASGLYWLNNRLIDEANYKTFLENEEKFDSCNPCLLKSFNSDGNLIYEGYQFSDCGVGKFIEYFDNGKPKVIGYYKQNLSSDWRNLVKRGYCSISDSIWTYFRKNGDVAYQEYWSNNTFIKQVPEQDSNEVWRVDLMVNGLRIEQNDSLSIEDFKNLEIVPFFKNQAEKGSSLSLTFSVSAMKRYKIESIGLLTEIKTFDIQGMKRKAGIQESDKVSYGLWVKGGEHVIKFFDLNIK